MGLEIEMACRVFVCVDIREQLFEIDKKKQKKKI